MSWKLLISFNSLGYPKNIVTYTQSNNKFSQENIFTYSVHSRWQWKKKKRFPDQLKIRLWTGWPFVWHWFHYPLPLLGDYYCGWLTTLVTVLLLQSFITCLSFRGPLGRFGTLITVLLQISGERKELFELFCICIITRYESGTRFSFSHILCHSS